MTGDIHWVDWFWLEGSAKCLVGARAGINPAELVDFILGWTTLDICDDDVVPEPSTDAGPGTRIP